MGDDPWKENDSGDAHGYECGKRKRNKSKQEKWKKKKRKGKWGRRLCWKALSGVMAERRWKAWWRSSPPSKMGTPKIKRNPKWKEKLKGERIGEPEEKGGGGAGQFGKPREKMVKVSWEERDLGKKNKIKSRA